MSSALLLGTKYKFIGKVRVIADKIRRRCLERTDQALALCVRRLQPAYTTAPFDNNPRFALLTVNFSTTRYLKLMLLTLAKQNQLDQLTNLIICDNASIDDAQPFLDALDSQVAKIQVIRNRYFLSHARGMRMALKALRNADKNKPQAANIVLFCDTDVIFLNPATLQDIGSAFVMDNAGFVGELRNNLFPYPEAQASFLAVRRDWVYRKDIAPWVHHGSPAYWLQRSIWRQGGKGLNFPSNKEAYILHRGRAGVKAAARYRPLNSYASVPNNNPHFMGVPNGKKIWDEVEAHYSHLLDQADYSPIIDELAKVFGRKVS
ncbi:MAG: hypothetical protein WC627_06730 [Legionella sp.]|jgi:hypothetical protein